MMNVIVVDVIVNGEQKKKKWKNGWAWNIKSDGVK